MTKIIIFLCLATIVSIPSFGQNKINDTLVRQLDTILRDDQMYREQRESIQTKYGSDSKEVRDLFRVMKEKDSVNLIKVEAIIDKYGWLGTNIVGNDGNHTLFLVIQHAELTVQRKYLLIMRDAVKNGKAKAGSLALLEDRVALAEGRKQIYGSQIGLNMDTQEYFIFPLADPENVDKKRAEVGLPTLSVYLSKWQMKWDIEQYKKDLPRIEASLHK